MSSEDHYNKVALHPPRQCTMLRRAHRSAKHLLINRAAVIAHGSMSGCTVVDFACGRGGDLPKCVGCKLYVGVDTAVDAVQECKRRAEEMGIHAVVHHQEACELPTCHCNLVLCNFALHYFCDTVEHCSALLDKVAACLSEGGTFCGTYEKRVGHIPWGQARHVVIGDCVNAIEWSVPWHQVMQLAFARRLALVYHLPLRVLHSDADPAIWGFIMQMANKSN